MTMEENWSDIGQFESLPHSIDLRKLKDLPHDRVQRLTEVLAGVYKSWPGDCEINALAIAIFVNYAKWAICIENITELSFDDQCLTRYMDFLINSSIRNACKKKDGALSVTLKTLESTLSILGVVSSALRKADLSDSFLWAKLKLLDTDLQRIKIGKFAERDRVLGNVDRILGIEQKEFDPSNIRSSLSAISHGNTNAYFDSSPPIDSSDGDHEDSISRGLEPNVLTQPTQLEVLPSTGMTMESRVDVRATLSSNSGSQQSKGSQRSTNGNSQKGSQQEEITSSLQQTVDAGSSKDSGINDSMVNNGHSISAGNNHKHGKKSRTRMTQQEIEILDAIRAKLPLLELIYENFPAPITENMNELFIQSTESQSKDKESQELVDSQELIRELRSKLEEEVEKREDLTRLLTRYFDEKFLRASEAALSVQKRVISLERMQSLIYSLVDTVSKLKEAPLRAEELINSIQQSVDSIESSHLRGQQDIANFQMINEANSQAIFQLTKTMREFDRRMESTFDLLEARDTEQLTTSFTAKNTPSSSIEKLASDTQRSIQEMTTTSSNQFKELLAFIDGTREAFESSIKVLDKKLNKESSASKEIIQKSQNEFSVFKTENFKNLDDLTKKFEGLESKQEILSKAIDDIKSSNNDKTGEGDAEDAIKRLRSDITKVKQNLRRKVEFDNNFLNNKFLEISKNMEVLNEAKAKTEQEMENFKNSTPADNVLAHHDFRIEMLMKEFDLMKNNQSNLEGKLAASERARKSSEDQIKRLSSTIEQLRSTRAPSGTNFAPFNRPATTGSANLIPPKPRNISPLVSALPSDTSSKISYLLSRPRPDAEARKRTASVSSSADSTVASIPELSHSQIGLKKIKLFRKMEE